MLGTAFPGGGSQSVSSRDIAPPLALTDVPHVRPPSPAPTYIPEEEPTPQPTPQPSPQPTPEPTPDENSDTFAVPYPIAFTDT